LQTIFSVPLNSETFAFMSFENEMRFKLALSFDVLCLINDQDVAFGSSGGDQVFHGGIESNAIDFSGMFDFVLDFDFGFDGFLIFFDAVVFVWGS
jgi:hypothetical protein